jgi:hypothetical protein
MRSLDDTSFEHVSLTDVSRHWTADRLWIITHLLAETLGSLQTTRGKPGFAHLNRPPVSIDQI